MRCTTFEFCERRVQFRGWPEIRDKRRVGSHHGQTNLQCRRNRGPECEGSGLRGSCWSPASGSGGGRSDQGQMTSGVGHLRGSRRGHVREAQAQADKRSTRPRGGCECARQQSVWGLCQARRKQPLCGSGSVETPRRRMLISIRKNDRNHGQLGDLEILLASVTGLVDKNISISDPPTVKFGCPPHRPSRGYGHNAARRPSSWRIPRLFRWALPLSSSPLRSLFRGEGDEGQDTSSNPSLSALGPPVR